MNPFQFKATCHICDEDGACDSETAGAAWLSTSFIAHSDPEVCARNLKKKANKLAKKEKEIKNITKAIFAEVLFGWMP